MYKTFGTLTLIALLLAPISMQAKPSHAVLATQGIIKIALSPPLAAIAVLGTAITRSNATKASLPEKSLLYTWLSISPASAASYLFYRGVKDLKKASKKEKPSE